MKRKLIMGFLVVALFFLGTWLFLPSFKEMDCLLEKEFSEYKFNGIVINKYIDSTDHSFPKIEIHNFNEEDILILNLIAEKTGLFHKLKVNDTLIKKYNTLYFVRKNFNDTLAISFGCEDKR